MLDARAILPHSTRFVTPYVRKIPNFHATPMDFVEIVTSTTLKKPPCSTNSHLAGSVLKPGETLLSDIPGLRLLRERKQGRSAGRCFMSDAFFDADPQKDETECREQLDDKDKGGKLLHGRPHGETRRRQHAHDEIDEHVGAKQ